MIRVGIAVVGPGDWAIHLHSANGDGKVVIAAKKTREDTVDLDLNKSGTHRSADLVPRLAHTEEFYYYPLLVGQFDLLAVADVQFHYSEQRTFGERQRADQQPERNHRVQHSSTRGRLGRPVRAYRTNASAALTRHSSPRKLCIVSWYGQKVSGSWL